MPKDQIVLFHANCADGFGAAWAFHYDERYRKSELRTDYVPMSYGDAPPDVTGADVFILDFSFSKEKLLKMAESAQSITLIDHHKTAQEELESPEIQSHPRIRVIFDMNHSGAILTAQYLGWKKLPKMLLYIEDRDLWKWSLPESRALNAALHSHARLFPIWNQLADWFEDSDAIAAMTLEGEAILRSQNRQVQEIAKKASIISICGFQVPCVNSSVLPSEIGNFLAQGKPFAVVFSVEGSQVIFSLRSTPEGEDVSQIAKCFNGGGHARAAGFSRSLETLLFDLSLSKSLEG